MADWPALFARFPGDYVSRHGAGLVKEIGSDQRRVIDGLIETSVNELADTVWQIREPASIDGSDADA
jgi:hypothetical protein